MSYAELVKNMRRISRLAILFLFIATTLAHADEQTLRVSVDMGFPPFEYVDETGKPAGFLVDVINQVAHDHHLSITYLPAQPGALKAMLEEDTIDMRATMYIDSSPIVAGAVSTPLWYTDYSVVVRQGSDIRDNAGIRSHIIATRTGDLAQTAASSLSSRLVGFDDWTTTLSAVIDGTADCAVIPSIICSHLLLQLGRQALMMISPPLWHATYRLEFKAADPALRDLVEQGLATMRDNGELDRIGMRWFAIQGPTGPPFLTGLVLAILAAALTMTAVVLAWALVLRRRLACAPFRALPAQSPDGEPLEHSHESAGQTPSTQSCEPDLTAENTKLIACLSRELRTPLLGVSGALELLKPAHLEPEHYQTLEMAMSSIRQLGRIMDSIDDVVDAIDGALRLQMNEFAYRQFAKAIEAETSAAAEIRGLTFRCVISGPDQLIISDEKRLAQVIRNLCNNAIEFTEHGEIDLLLTLESGGLHIVVRDTGPGLSDDARQELFMPRYKDEKGKPAAKLGLGLTMAKAIVDALRGSIDYTSNLNQGTEFAIVIPVATASRPVAEDIPVVAEALHINQHTGHGKAIIAEDEAINRLYLKRVLELAGYQVAQAPNGAAALETALEGVWDFILMDVSMPKMDGLEATRRIRAHETSHGGHTPIIALTAHAYTEDRQACVQAGMDGFLSKPFTETALWTEIQRVLTLLQAARATEEPR